MKLLHNQYFDLRYFTRFAILFVLLYTCCLVVVGLTTPGGAYSETIVRYGNFPLWIRNSVLHGARLLTTLLGIPTHVAGDQLRTMDGMAILQMGWPCYGMMIKSFWAAFVLSQHNSIRHKATWLTTGIILIWMINCCRLTILMMAMVYQWSFSDKLSASNHDLFNYVAYLFIIGMMYLYKKNIHIPMALTSNSKPNNTYQS